MNHPISTKIKAEIREVPDFPKPGINFYDISPVLRNGALFHEIVQLLSKRYRNEKIDIVAGIDARGFVIGASLAFNLKKGFIPVRKPGKLPPVVEQANYTLEYGEATLEIHRDALNPASRVLLVDDLLATGGTANAASRLIERIGGKVVECVFLVELMSLKGRQRLTPAPVISLVKYDH